jgi:hypothetical protein
MWECGEQIWGCGEQGVVAGEQYKGNAIRFEKKALNLHDESECAERNNARVRGAINNVRVRYYIYALSKMYETNLYGIRKILKQPITP